MNFDDKEHIAFTQVRQQRGEISGFFNGRAGGHAQVHSHFIGDDARERCFTEAGRAVEQHMVEGLPAPTRRLYINTQVLFDFFLPDIICEHPRAERGFQIRILRHIVWGDDAIFKIRIHNSMTAFFKIPLVSCPARQKEALRGIDRDFPHSKAFQKFPEVQIRRQDKTRAFSHRKRCPPCRQAFSP